MNKRHFLTTAGLALLGSPLASSSLFGPNLKNHDPVKGIPQAWVDAKGLAVLEYANYIQDLNLRNITPRQVLAPHFKTRGHTHNTLPPKSEWTAMAKTLKTVDKLVDTLGAPLKEILSAYRSPKYNRAVGGASKSFHMQNIATDLKFHNLSAHHVFYVAQKLRKDKVFKGGLGKYPSFVHLDTRGRNDTW